ncbi:sensor histidine kinase [Allonocardiopsis opalescens]|uniref:histidine kinase n=1 Tax=Allonocardiopsis opalescens TaxID=1144618 RepID=A0A2T0QF39_9ACTN|nr:HAMP domain-containing sensor histidine kinase [Allonocardiopsis opalescens]PRY02500.1 signal transduction histidine kinase [Allonocardiopsis opalescens]
MRAVRPTARARLALLHTGLVLAAGVLLTALTYLLMLRGRQHQETRLERTPPGGSGPGPAPDRELAELTELARSAAQAEFLTQAAIALAVVTALAAVLGWLVAGRVLRPIRTIAATAQRLSAENISERVPVTAPADELATLAGTINGMLDRIQQGIAERDRVLAAQRMFTASAAHELRTPLATVRTAIDVTLDGRPSTAELLAMAGDVRTAIEHGQATLDGLLMLARSQAGTPEARPADLAEVAAGALEAAAGPAAAGGLAVRAELRPAPVTGEPSLLERLAGNLVDNAVRYNLAGGRVAVATGTEADASRVFLRVTNTGPRVRAAEADRLLEPFVRGEADRTRADGGAGLGLSIVRAIAAAHHGTVVLTARPAGGLDITVRFPARPPEAPTG